MKKLFFFLVLLILGVVIYQKRDIFRSNDTLKFTRTPETLLKKVKVYAFVNNPTIVEYKNGSLLDNNGNHAILVSNEIGNYPFSKNYQHADFYIIIDEKYFCNSVTIDKKEKNAAYDIELSLSQVDSSYYVSGNIKHHNEIVTSFKSHPTTALGKGIKVTYFRNDGLSKTEWTK